MSWRDYVSLKGEIDDKPESLTKNKYGITSDILSYQLCRRQYGFFAVRGYEPAHVVQYWYGMVVHQVLDKLHLHYQGLIDDSTKGKIPSSKDVEKYFNYVDESLRARGIRAINTNLRQTALSVIKIFNEIEGSKLYPNVIDTECDLQSDQGNFILHGVVDLLKENSSSKNVKGYDKVEIWDYKGSEYPDTNNKYGEEKLNRYIFQMFVYAYLYKLKNGKYPLKAKIYFMNELLGKDGFDETPTEAIYEIKFKESDITNRIEEALGNFSNTVVEIESHMEYDNWQAPKERPDSETCDICDLRWDCAAVKNIYQMRYP